MGQDIQDVLVNIAKFKTVSRSRFTCPTGSPAVFIDY